MTDIIMHGCNGRMGRFITQLCDGDEEARIVAGIDPVDTTVNTYPVFRSIEECNVRADVVIDFSYSGAADGLLDYCTAHRLPCVLCTTGLSEEQLKKVEEASKKVAILRSANMSLGINLIMKLLEQISGQLYGEGFDMEIVEKHHNQKLDAPSGTAIALADALNKGLDSRIDYVYDRSERRQKRPKEEIGISAVRGGSIVGEHDVIFAGTDEVITISHTAYSRNLFARGAFAAAKYLAGKGPGMYSMKDVVRL